MRITLQTLIVRAYHRLMSGYSSSCLLRKILLKLWSRLSVPLGVQKLYSVLILLLTKAVLGAVNVLGCARWQTCRDGHQCPLSTPHPRSLGNSPDVGLGLLPASRSSYATSREISLGKIIQCPLSMPRGYRRIEQG